MKDEHRTVIAKLIARQLAKGPDPLGNVEHNFPTVEEWEGLQSSAEQLINEVLDIGEVTVCDDGNVEWHYDQPDSLIIGWLDSSPTHWTFQQYDAIELGRSSDGSLNYHYWH
jgi:hypothetical protein